MQILFWLSLGLDRREPSEHILNAVIEELCMRGHTVHILQKNTGGNKRALSQKLVDLGVTTTRIKCNPVKKNNLIARYFADILYARKCRKWIKENRGFDRVFMQSSNIAGLQVFILQNALQDAQITFNVQDIFPENAAYSQTILAKGLAYKLLSAVQKYAYKKVDAIITISEDMKEQLVDIGVDENKIQVIYNWSYTDTPYDRNSLDYTRVKPMFDPSKFHVVYAGNIGRMQNIEVLIRMAVKMQEQQDILFHIFGDGVYKEKLEAMAQRLNVNNLIFHPMLEEEDAPALYASADINVIPLVSNIYRTALPSKTAICLACGKPILFALGLDSKFGQKAARLSGCPLLESNDIDGLCSAVQAIKEGRIVCDTASLFKDGFLKTQNSVRYAELIEADRKQKHCLE